MATPLRAAENSGAMLAGIPLTSACGSTDHQVYRTAINCGCYLIATDGTTDDLRELLDAIGLDLDQIRAGQAQAKVSDG